MGPSSEEEPEASEADVLLLLRSEGLSIKHLDPQTKQRVRNVLSHWYLDEGASQGDIAKVIGNKSSGYVSWLARQLGIQARDFEEARLKGIHEKVRKYERKPFSGTDEDKAYMMGLRHGDLSAYIPFGDAIRVSTSTTHPPMADLFWKLFEPFGHVNQHPRYKKDTRSYEWNLHAILDRSFEFLLQSHGDCWRWVERGSYTALGYIAGLMDAEGNVTMMPSHGKTTMSVSIHNTDLELVSYVVKLLCHLGYNPRGPYLSKRRGPRSSGYRIEMKKDYWRVGMFRFKEVQELLAALPVKHLEKVAMKELALATTPEEPWTTTASRVRALRGLQRKNRDEFVQQARLEFLRKHPEPT